MRTDILVSSTTKDVKFVNSTSFSHCTFTWDSEDESNIYGSLVFPSYTSDSKVKENGVTATIPYKPVDKAFRLSIRQENSSTPMVSKAAVTSTLLDNKTINACQLPMVDGEFVYHFVPSNNGVAIYSGRELDLDTGDANDQNRYMMLLCAPGNNYRYPLTGVDVLSWINTHRITSAMAETLQTQFTADGTPVINASLDAEAQVLTLELNTSNV